MWLLNTKTLKLEGFWDGKRIPAYAILSHTWGEQEVSFQAIADLESATQLIGFSKIQACCQQALTDSYEWVWIDTCCIDKSSSAELSEAINSMYIWYRKSKVCYAYLADVPSEDDPQTPGSAFSRSRWFTRGWTLQELIAPGELEFFCKDWAKIGNRRDLSSQISDITRIDNGILTGSASQYDKSIAKRMSWASRRSTTRKEDMAYCLMGLFDVNMPLLYGEGGRAFIRLQEEILKHSSDQSLFAWTSSEYKDRDEYFLVKGGFLASSPSDFEHSSNHFPFVYHWTRSLRPYSMTNMGLQIELQLFQDEEYRWIGILECSSSPYDWNAMNSLVGLYLVLEREYPACVLAQRNVKRAPLSLKLKDRVSDGFHEWATVLWDSPDSGSCEIRTELRKLYVPQGQLIVGSWITPSDHLKKKFKIGEREWESKPLPLSRKEEPAYDYERWLPGLGLALFAFGYWSGKFLMHRWKGLANLGLASSNKITAQG